METILIIGIVVAGFTIFQWLNFKHITRLELLLKANDIAEVKHFETKPKIETVGSSKPETLSEATEGKNPDQIRKIFNS